MSIIASENGIIENRILDVENDYKENNLKQVSNYLNSKFMGSTIEKIKTSIQKEINVSKSELDLLSSKLVKEGVFEVAPNKENPYIFLHGQSSLLEDEMVSNDLDQLRNLFDDIENKSKFLNILENTINAQGVQIFIGSQNFLFKHSGLSMVMAPYKNNEQKIIGAIGVVGPTRIDYAKIVPLVDYTSKVIGRIIG
jgi:heat-inducible transcriptional repressor